MDTEGTGLIESIQSIALRLMPAYEVADLPGRFRSCLELIDAGEEGVALEILVSNLYELDLSLSAVEAAQLMLAGERFDVSTDELDQVAVDDAVVPIGRFRAAIRRREHRWDASSVTWKLTLGKATPKPAAWLDLRTDTADGQMILWVSGEVELMWGRTPSSEPAQEHREISSDLELETCLNDLEAALVDEG